MPQISTKDFERKVVNSLTRKLKILWDTSGLAHNEEMQTKIKNYPKVRLAAENGFISLNKLIEITAAVGFSIAIVGDNSKIYPIIHDSNENAKTYKRIIADHNSSITEFAKAARLSIPYASKMIVRTTSSFNTVFNILEAYPGKLAILISSDIQIPINKEEIETMPRHQDLFSSKED